VAACGTDVQAANTLSDDRYFDESTALTLFAFDDVAIPFTQNLKLAMRTPERYAGNPVVERGPAGTPDAWAVQFYGSVLREHDRLRMWYVAAGDDRLRPGTPRSAPWRVGYAEGADGFHWTKPELGLVDYEGRTRNSLVRLAPRLGVVNLKVLRDDADPDPSRRYKLGAQVWWHKHDVRLGTFAPYASADGLDWKLMIDAEPIDAELPPEKLLLPPTHFEPVGGMYQRDGLFHLVGQNAVAAARPYHGRVVRQFVSRDFVHWMPASAISFVWTPQHQLLGPGRSREGEQNHEGLSIWNRGNVLIGIAILPRDRFAALQVDDSTQGPGVYQIPHTVAELLTSAVPLSADRRWRVFANASGLGSESRLRVEVLSHDLTPLRGYSGDAAAILRGDGFQIPVRWGGGESLPEDSSRVRFRIAFEGARRSDLRLHAIYVRPETVE
jgi:hypothetical protein